MKIEVKENYLIINENKFQFPFKLEELTNVLGKYSFSERICYFWDDLGLECTVPDKNGVSGLYIHFEKPLLISNPTNSFSGEYLIDGESYITKQYKDKEIIGDLEILNVRFNDKISVSLIQPYIAPEIENPDLYAFKKIEGQAIIFKDLNFKLAVLEILMYNKKLIQPVFYLDEFVKRYKNREIKMFSEGENIIPEALTYFENLEIDIKFASEITELFQDDITQIYSQIIPFGDKKAGYFNIQDIQDIENFPNLKSITLFESTDKSIIEQFIKRGIEVIIS